MTHNKPPAPGQRMKISADTYEEMKRDIQTVALALKIDIATADGGKTGLKTLWWLLDIVSRNRAYDDSHPGFANKAWARVLPYDGREYCFYYAGGCDDTHVATALRKIKSELTK